MDMNYKLAVYIGRFQPYHRGHQKTVMFGFDLAPKMLVVIGSHPEERTIKNPFTFEERKQMILDSIEPHKAAHSIKVRALDDYPSDAVWCNQLDDIVKQYEKDDSKIVLIGDHSDPDSKYLNLLEWDVIGRENDAGVHATVLRHLFFSNKLEQMKSMVPESTYRFLKAFQNDLPSWYRFNQLQTLYIDEERKNANR